MAQLSVQRLSKTFAGTLVLREVSITVASGSLVAILGASGSGKTTLLRLIAGFERPDQGEIWVDEELMAAPGRFRRPEQRRIGYVAQEGALFPHLSVADNITFGLGRPARRQRQRVNELLNLVGLPMDYAERAPQALSGGEQQRVALARALAPEPRLLLLDEPFSALDAGLRAETRAAIAGAIAAAGATAVLVTHDQDEALSMGAEVGVLQNGVLAQMSRPQALYHHPLTPELANFVGAAVFLPGIAKGNIACCALGELKLAAACPASGPVEVMLRPEQIKLAATNSAGAVPAAVDRIVFYGHDAVVRLTIAGPTAFPPCEVTARVFSQSAPPTGAEVWLHVEGEVMAYAGPIVAPS